jgi:hypothetical protein
MQTTDLRCMSADFWTSWKVIVFLFIYVCTYLFIIYLFYLFIYSVYFFRFLYFLFTCYFSLFVFRVYFFVFFVTAFFYFFNAFFLFSVSVEDRVFPKEGFFFLFSGLTFHCVCLFCLFFSCFLFLFVCDFFLFRLLTLFLLVFTWSEYVFWYIFISIFIPLLFYFICFLSVFTKAESDVELEVKFAKNPSSSGAKIEGNIISFTEKKGYTYCIDKDISEGIMKMLDIYFI